MHAFCANIFAPKIIKLCFGFEIFWCQNIGKKSERKMLMKLTQGLLVSQMTETVKGKMN